MTLICLGQCSCSLLASPPHWHVPPSSPPASSQTQHHPLLFSPDSIVCGRGDLSTEQVIIPNSMSELLSLRKLLAGPHSQGISPSRDIRLCACHVHEAPHCVHSRHSFPFLPFPSLLGLCSRAPELPQECPRFLLSNDYAEQIGSLLVTASQAE